MEKEDAVILAARKEVQGHANVFLVKPIVNVFEEIYARSMGMDGKIRTFQKALREIPQWTSHIVSKCAERIQRECDFLPQLITALFLSHIKILSSIKINKISHIRVKVPKREKFLHAVLIESARAFYENPMVFRAGDVRHKEVVVSDAIEVVVRKFLPLKDILSAYLSNRAGINSAGEDEEIETPVNEDEGAGSEDLNDLVQQSEEEEEEEPEAEPVSSVLPDPPPVASPPSPVPEEPVRVPTTVTIPIQQHGKDNPPRSASVRKGMVFYRDPDVKDRLRI
jgi:hypothetical protein